jgi:hypothetical protein
MEKNSCESGSCGSCAVGLCGSGACGGCGHNHHSGIKLLAKVIALIFIVCFSLKVGEIKGMLESNHMYRSQGAFRGNMMYGNGSGWDKTQPTPTESNNPAPVAPVK